jgi:hypothetical protein
MSTTYNNLPPKKSSNSDATTLKAFDTFYTKPLELSVSDYDATVAFFTGKGFDRVAAESVAVIIMKQAKYDGYNPMQILDTLKGLSNVEISALVAEVINYNRFKTSFLGYALDYNPNEQVIRNIIP